MLEYSFSITDLEYFLLIMTRVSAFVFIAPFFGMSNTPARVKIVFSLAVSYLLYYSITPKVYPEYSTVFGYAVVVIKEALTGLAIGWGAQMCTSIVNFAGRIIDTDMGLSMMSEYDPTTKQESTITGMFYQYGVLLILLISGMYQFLLGALNDSFTLIPINGAVFSSDKMVSALLEFMLDYMVIGFRIALPIFASIMLMNAILGILAKVAPQMNMFAVGIQLKIVTGLCVLFLTIGMLPGISDFIMEQIKVVTKNFVEAVM